MCLLLPKADRSSASPPQVLRLAYTAVIDEVVGAVEASLLLVLEVALRPPFEIRHDHAEHAARLQHPKGVGQRARHVLAAQMLQHMARINRVGGAIGERETKDNVAIGDV
jgi:hypothetical protein